MPDAGATLANIIATAEARVAERQDELLQATGRLAALVGPLATAHRLAELAREMFDLARTKSEIP